MHNRTVRSLLKNLPSHFHTEDARHGRVLEALMKLLGEELQLVERNVDQMYDNFFVETAEPWILPYLAELVAASPMRDIGAGSAGLRAYVANVIQLRQVKGTAAAIEQVASEVTGWPIVAVEFFQKLATSQNINHLRPDLPIFASVRNSAISATAHGPFERALHSPAAGPVSAFSGRYNISNIGLFAWRQRAQFTGFLTHDEDGYLGGVLARRSIFGSGLRHFDPLGRDLPLVNRPIADASIEGRMSERHVPANLDRNKLHIDLNRFRNDEPDSGLWFKRLPVIRVRVGGVTVPIRNMHCCNLETASDGTWRRPKSSGEILFDPVLGRLSLHASDQNKRVELESAFARPFDCGGGSYDRSASVHSWKDDFFTAAEDDLWRIGVTLRAQEQTDNIDAGGPVVETLKEAVSKWNVEAKPGSRGIITVMDNSTYNANLAGADKIFIPTGASLAIVAAGWPKQDLGSGIERRVPDALLPAHRHPHLKGNIEVHGRKSGDTVGGRLILDGLLIEGNVTLTASGNLSKIDIYHCTVSAGSLHLDEGLEIAGGNHNLESTVRSSIIGRINLRSASGGLIIEDSIIGEDRVAGENPEDMDRVVDALNSDTEISRSTIMGRARSRTIEAENSLFLGVLDVARKQKGCVRFCYAPIQSDVPRRYKCAPDTALENAAKNVGHALSKQERMAIINQALPVFVNRKFSLSSFAQLGLGCSKDILQGAEDGMEMGVGYQLRHPACMANLADAMEEFLPFGLLADPIFIS